MLQLPWRAVQGVKRFEEVSMLNEETISLESPPDDFVLQEGQSNEEYTGTGEKDNMSELIAEPLTWRHSSRRPLWQVDYIRPLPS